MTQRASKQLDDTIAALQGDLTSIDPASAIDLLERWQAVLADAEEEGAEDLASLLVQLQSELENEEPSAALIAELLAQLSSSTQDLADSVDDEAAGKLQLLADLLGDAGDNLER